MPFNFTFDMRNRDGQQTQQRMDALRMLSAANPQLNSIFAGMGAEKANALGEMLASSDPQTAGTAQMTLQGLLQQTPQAQQAVRRQQQMESLAFQSDELDYIQKQRQMRAGGLEGNQLTQFAGNVRSLARGVQYGQELIDLVTEYGGGRLATVPDAVQGQAASLGFGLLNVARTLLEAGALAEQEYAIIQEAVGDPTNFSLGNLTGAKLGRLSGFTRLIQDRLEDLAMANPELAASRPDLFAIPGARTRTPPPRGFQEFTP